jgi:arylsulfatase A-like enzyme
VPPSLPPTPPVPIGTIPLNPNILHFAPDDIGREYWRIYNKLPAALQIDLPNITKFAQAGVTFLRAYSQPWCSPTRAAWLTGRYGNQTGIGSLAEGQNQPLLASEVCLPSAIKTSTEGLYRTGAFGKWHLSEWATRGGAYEHPIRTGFDHFEGVLRNLEAAESYDDFEAFTAIPASDGRTVQVKRYHVTEWAPRYFADRAGEWIRAQTGPWYCYFPVSLPHAPYNRPPEETYDTALYDLPDYAPPSAADPSVPTYFKAMSQALDWTFGYLLEQIPQAARANTVIILWSDNGTQSESFDTLAKTGLDLVPYLGADYTLKSKRTVYELGCNIPLIVAGPKVMKPGRTSSSLVAPADLFKTVIGLCDGDYSLVPFPSGGTRQSTSFLADLESGTPSARASVPIDLFGPNGPNVACTTTGSRARSACRS